MKNLITRFFITTGLLFLGWSAFAQPANDECAGAIDIPNVSNWCSDPGEYSNEGATVSGYGPATCWTSNSNDVWFSFQAEATDVTIIIRGNTNQSQGGSLARPEAALYDGVCNGTINQLECETDNAGSNIIELYQGGLTVGNTYLLRVQGRSGNEGTFQICINNYFPPEDPTSDCPTASILCDKSPFVVSSVTGAGDDINELNDATCFSNGSSANPESNSTWFTWIAATSGTLTFTLTPLNPTDDLDFVIYELPNGVSDCSNKILLRCMASGDFSFPSRCMGPTGLQDGQTDTSEPAGCNDPSQDNFIAPLDMVAGTAYALAINNFTSTGNGFSIEFGGTGEFLGPEVDFTIEPELNNQCDIDQIQLMDNSDFQLGDITGWDWNFGSGAQPASSNGEGPHDVVYNSFGTKSIVLTIQTDLGCRITAIKEIFIEPCCDPNNTLELDVINTDEPDCFGFEDGSISVDGSGGSPDYSYSLDGDNFGPTSNFGNLAAGNYTIYVQDIKGCEEAIDVNLSEPPPLIVDAGPDVTVDLGQPAPLSGTINVPPDNPVDLMWDPSGSLSCFDCLNPLAVAPGQTTYTLTITDSTNCTASDSMTVFVQVNRPVYIPNAFSPNQDGVNDYFTVFGGAAVDEIKEMRVYNRWGDEVYRAFDIPSNQETVGWDGTFRGEPVNPDVFAYMVVVRFIDGEEILYKGDITLIR